MVLHESHRHRFRGYTITDDAAKVMTPERSRRCWPAATETVMDELTQLGPYKIEGLIGAGGMGQVFRATDTRLHRTVAIKILPHGKVADPDRKRRFLQEARAASALNHPNIITLHDIATDAGVDYLVMEYVPGKPLNQLITTKGLPLDEVIGYATQIAGALAAAHAAGIVHRDIKPANVIVTGAESAHPGQVKVLDFGLAKLEERGPAPEGETRAMEPTLTEAGMVMGTVAYMSPEQARGEEVDARTDLFSLGAMLYEMATGRRPFLKALDWATPPIGPLPAELRPIVLKLLEVDRELRYQHASEVRTDLQRLKRDTDSARMTTNEKSGATTDIVKRWKVMVAAAAVVLALFAAGYFYFHRTARLTGKDRIVLADFMNKTGDPVFDGTLRQGLAVQLGQSPFLSLVSDERIQRALSLMGRPADAPLTPQLAKEICERTASNAVLEGSIASLGSQYVLGLRAENCHTGDVLDEEQVQAARKEDVLNALSQIASKFRTRVGESLTTVEKHSTPLQEATTPSLEALKAYSAAWKVLHSTSDLGATVPLLKRAIEIDPKFAMAYASLGFNYGLMGEPALSAENNSKAYALRDRASDAEKFFITATYHLQVTGDLEKALQICELWEQTYPRDVSPHALLGAFLYPTFGKFEKGIEEGKKQIDLDPDFPIGYLQLAFNYQFADRLEEAQNTGQRAAARKLDIPDLYPTRYDIAFLKGDKTGMEREVALARRKPGAEDLISLREGFVLAYSGHLQQARKKSQRAVDLDQQAGQRGRAALFETAAALWEAFFGNAPEARRGATAALALANDRDVEYGAAFALALAGDSSQSQTVASDLEKRFPEDSEVKFGYLPGIRALLALNHGEPAKAIELLQLAKPYDLGVPLCSAPAFFGVFYPIYVRGLAYLAAHQSAEAAAEFQKILDHRSVVVSDPIGALAHLQLGRAFALSGDKTKAKSAYQDFLNLWKDADPDIPILQQAKAEYAKLQ